jgi:hypothetical protein
MVKEFIRAMIKNKIVYLIATLNRENYILVTEPYYNKTGELIKIGIGIIDREIKHLLKDSACTTFEIPKIEKATIKSVEKIEGTLKNLNKVMLNDDKIDELRLVTLNILVDELMLEIEKVYNI